MVAETYAEEALTVRELRPRDAEAVAALAKRCSGETVYRRFHGVPADPGAVLAGQVRRLEPVGRAHLGATVGDRVVGLASLVPLATAEWEVALLVEDAWQGHGVGRTLTRAVAEVARRRGARRVRASFLSDAPPAVRALLLSTRWRTLGSAGSGGVVDVVLEVTG